MFTKTYELSLTKNYVSRWGMEHAVRELIQNGLDSDSPFVYEFKQGEDDKASLLLRSEFTVLTPQTLLLGSTSKANSSDSIGSFGEGYKIALLVLTRLGYDVEMRNGDVLWKPRFRFNSKFGEELLVIEERSLPDKQNKGLTFVVHGLSEQDVEAIRRSCILMQDSIGQIHETQWGDILLEQPKRLYVGGLYVCDTDLTYGYNIKPKFLKLERDRQTVDGFDLRMVTKEMWFDTGNLKFIAELLEAGIPDVSYAQFGSPEIVKEACYRHFIALHPGAVVAKDHAELKALIAAGMTKVVTVSAGFYSAVTGSTSYKSRPSFRVESPRELLEAWFAKAKYDMADKHKATFRALLGQSKEWRVGA